MERIRYMLIFATMINDVDDRAFMQEVYQQNERLMYAIALKYASNTQDCEDIVHDTVEKLCKNIISEVILGPKCQTEPQDVQMFLQDSGYGDQIKVHKSKIPYR